MKEEALKLADERDTIFTINDAERWMYKSQTMIRRLVEELDEKNYRILELTKRYKALDRTGVQSISIEGGEL